jgi:hypothetical protein
LDNLYDASEGERERLRQELYRGLCSFASDLFDDPRFQGISGDLPVQEINTGCFGEAGFDLSGPLEGRLRSG